MDLISSWAERIAQEAAPDEVDLAPAMAHAFVRGGQDRKDMFRRPREAVPGAFGPEFGVAVFPQILAAIQYLQDVGPALSDFFVSTKDAWAGANSFIGALNLLLAIGSRSERKESVDNLPDDQYGALKTVIVAMTRELEAAGRHSRGVPDESCDLVTFCYGPLQEASSSAARRSKDRQPH